METRAVILLGYRNTGKDTLANAFISQYAGFINVKFSSYPKQQLANALGVPTEWMEDKQWREKPINKNTDLSALDLLNLMFHGRQGCPEFSQKTISYCLDNIPNCTTPIFTDVRDVAEYNAIATKFDEVLIVRLTRDGCYGRKGDELLPRLIGYLKSDIDRVLDNKTVEYGVSILASMLQPKPLKPALRVYITKGTPVITNYKLYEPMCELATDLTAIIIKHGMGLVCFNKLFNTAYCEASAVKVSTPEPNSYMVYNRAQHEFLLPKIREKTPIQLMVHGTLDSYALVVFTQEELTNALYY